MFFCTYILAFIIFIYTTYLTRKGTIIVSIILLNYPLLIPFISKIIFGSPVIAVSAFNLQIETNFIYFAYTSIILNISILILSIFYYRPSSLNKCQSIEFSFDPVVFFFLCFLLFLFATRVAVGPDILFNTYYDVVKARRLDSGSEYASAFIFAIHSFLFYIFVNNEHYKRIFIIRFLFLFIFILTSLYLFLHGQRAEVTGFLIVHFYFRRIAYKNINISFFTKFIIYLFSFLFLSSSYWRSIGLINSINNIQSVIFKNINSISYPGGAGEASLTFLSVIEKHQKNRELTYFFESIFNSFLRMIPTPIYQLFEIKLPPTLYDIYHRSDFIGGNLIFSIFLENFGLFGITLLAFFIFFIHKKVDNLWSLSSFKGVLYLSIFSVLIRVYWFNEITAVKVFYAVVLLFFSLQIISILFKKH